MGGTGVIDRFLEVFTSYIDSGFGLLNSEVAFLSSTLVAIDITLAGLFWALASDEDVIARLIRKTLYVGFFAFLIGNFNTLAKVIFNSFAGLGLKASGIRPIRRSIRSARPDRAGRYRCRQADPAGCQPADGLRRVLRELRPDRRAADRLARRARRLFHPSGAAVHHADRVQAHHTRRLCARPVRSVQQDGLPRRARAGQRH